MNAEAWQRQASWPCGLETSYKFKPLIIIFESPLYLHSGAATRKRFTIHIQRPTIRKATVGQDRIHYDNPTTPAGPC